MPPRRDAGFTLVELMIALVASCILVIFALEITAQVTATTGAQSDIASTSQALRAAADLVGEDVREAGYLVGTLHVNTAAVAAGILPPLSVLDAQDATPTDPSPSADEVRTFGADDSNEVLVDPKGPAFVSAESAVTSVGGFVDGELAIAVNPSVGGDCAGGGAQSCILYITHVQPAASHLQHHPFAPWNDAQNRQCDNLKSCWTDGRTQFMLFRARAYRIAPASVYPEGMLQMSPSGGMTAGDWVNLAPGFVDLQAALCIDANGNGLCDPTEWVNADAALLAQPTPGKVVAARVTLIARTQFPMVSWKGGVQPPAEDHTPPPFTGSAQENAAYFYRAFTQTLELRNGPL